MYSLLALVGTITACVIAHSPVRDASIEPLSLGRQPCCQLKHINRKSISEYLLPRYLAERLQYVAKEEHGRIPYPRPLMPTQYWLDKEIYRINKMEDGSAIKTKEESNWLTREAYRRILFGSDGSYRLRNRGPSYYTEYMPQLKAIVDADNIPRRHAKILYPTLETITETPKFTEVEAETQKEPQVFALTPLDEGYFEPTEKDNSSTDSLAGILEGHHEGGGQKDSNEVEMHREIRQNPNHSRTKALVDKDLDKLREGLGSDSSDEPKHIRVLGSEFARGTVYAVAVAVGVGTVIILAVLGFAFGWYIITKRAKAAAEVDYPAYGVTGPTLDSSGDRKLAHSAQMYHYQHQKQQIIAMERNNTGQRNGSISDPESEENEEGDYTVYECPGFATTGDLEVKNPLFNEEKTPTAAGKPPSKE